MEPQALRVLIRQRLAAGHLPQEKGPRVWSGPGQGEICDACSLVVGHTEPAMDVPSDAVTRELHFHVACFHAWQVERSASGPHLNGTAARHNRGAVGDSSGAPRDAGDDVSAGT
jgi:hypothetical protein